VSFVLSKKAEQDILGIYLDGVNRFGANQAERYFDQLEDTFRFLSANPEAARERFEIMPPVRIHPFRSHIVVYVIEDSGDIFIIRVRHSHEDWLND
jgi:toxin ParE1/3/4